MSCWSAAIRWRFRGRSHGGSDRVYEDLNRLAALMPQRYADVFRFRWGLDSHFPHLASQTARKFEIPKGTAEEMLNRCLWNVARYAHVYERPALCRLLGDDRGTWPERAWQQADRRWGNEESNFSETVLLLAAGGLDVPDAHRHARQHMREMGMGRGKRWPKPLTAEEQADVARAAIDRILGQIILVVKHRGVARLEGIRYATAAASLGPSEVRSVSQRKARPTGDGQSWRHASRLSYEVSGVSWGIGQEFLLRPGFAGAVLQ